MAHYTPDYKSIEGKKLLEALTGEEGELIKYHVAKKDEYIAELQNKIKEMYEVFKSIGRYIK